MNAIINFFAKWTGIGKIWDWLDGKKVYGTAILGILTALVGLGSEIAPILASHNFALLWTFVQGLAIDPNWLALLASFGLIGVGHKLDKAAEPTV